MSSTPLLENDRFVKLEPAAGTTALDFDFELGAVDDLGIQLERDGLFSVLVKDVDYTVSSAGNENGGTADLVVASLEGDRYYLYGATVLDRQVDFKPGANFSTTKINADLDKLTRISQELRRDLNRALMMPFGFAGALELHGLVPGQFVKFNDAGDAFETAEIVVTGGGAGAVALSELTDVAAADATSGNVLIADGTSYSGRALVVADISNMPAYLTSISGEGFGSLGDVALSSPQSGDGMGYDGSNWVNIPLITSAEVTNGDGTDVRMFTMQRIHEAIDQHAPTGGGGGTSVDLDLGDDGNNESNALSEIATIGDANNIFSHPSADKLLIDVSQNWPTAVQALNVADGVISTADKVVNGVLPLTKLADVQPDRLVGNLTVGAGPVQELSAAQVRAFLSVEENADVTDADNVAAAGATMDNDASVAGNGWVLDQDDLLDNDPNKVPTQKSVKAYVDTGLAAKSDVGHDHGASSIVSGTFADARIAQSSVVQHQAVLTIDWAQLVNAPAVVTPTDNQTLSNKTLIQPTITLKQGTAPAPTSEGDVQWDTDDHKIKIGDGGSTKAFSADDDLRIGSANLTTEMITGLPTVVPVAGDLIAVFDADGNALGKVDASAFLVGSGDMLSSNSLSDVASAEDARANIGLEIGVDVQAFDAHTTKNDVANSFTKPQIMASEGVTFNANITFDLSTAPVKTLTLAGNTTFEAPSNVQNGSSGVFEVTQDGAGGHAITWNTAFDLGNSPPAIPTGANKKMIFFWYVDQSGSVQIQIREPS